MKSKKFFSFVLVFVLMATLILPAGTPALAVGPTTVHVSTWSALKSAVTAAAQDSSETDIVLDANLTADSAVSLKGNQNIVIVAGTGTTITRASLLTGAVFNILTSTDQLTLKNVTLDGGSATADNAIVNVDTGTFTMDGATITNIHGNTWRNLAVYINVTATMNFINNSAITNVINTNASGDGAISVGGILNIDGGTVTNCRSVYGGISNSGTINISGAPTISGNTSDGATACNLYLMHGAFVTVSGTLSNTIPIGISTYDTPTAGTPVNITSNNASDLSAYFTSDNPGYTIINSGSGSSQKVQLAAPNVTGISSWAALKSAVTAAPVGTTIIDISGSFNTDNAVGSINVVSGHNIVIESQSPNNYTITRIAAMSSYTLFSVDIGGQLTLKNITLDGGGTLSPLPTISMVFVNQGTFIMDGATIQNAILSSMSTCAGVQANLSTEIMKNGAKIINCKNTSGSFDYGGAMLVDGGTLKIADSCSITGCSAARGGICINSSGTLNLTGSPNISGNTKPNGTTPCNVYITSSGTNLVRVTEPFSPSPIGITTATAPTASSSVNITTGTNSRDLSGYFVSDNPSYVMQNTGSGATQQVKLGLPAITGTVNLTVDPSTGQVTASATGGNTGSAGTLTYTWTGGASGTGTTKTPTLGSAATCTVTASAAAGSIQATTTVYVVSGTVSGLASSAGVTVNYTVNGSGTLSTTTDAGGNFSFAVPTGANAVITPSAQLGYTKPSDITLTNITSNSTGKNLVYASASTTVNSWAALSAAVSAAPAGTTIIDISGSFSTDDTTGTIDIASGQNIVLESASPNTYTITRDAAFTHNTFFNIKTGGQLTLQNITLDGNTSFSATKQMIDVSGGTFTMDTGATIENVNRSALGNTAGIYVETAGIMNLKPAATISSVVNNGAGGTGAIYVKGTLNMTGGLVTQCKANNGAAITSDFSGGIVNMSGGSITDNVSDNGAIFIMDGTFNISGSPFISGNKNSNGLINRNVGLFVGQTISITSALTNVTPIGISAYFPTAGHPVNITTASSQDWSSKFTNDDSGYIIQNSGSGATQVVQLAVPSLTGTVDLTVDPSTGQVTANATGGNTGSVGTLTYTWSGGATGTGATKTPTLGSAATCTVTASGAEGAIQATTTVYKVAVSKSGNSGTDNASITNAYGKVGDSVSIAYVLGNSGTASNTLTYSGASSNPATVSTAGSGASTYVIAPGDATSGTVTLTATFAHTSVSGGGGGGGGGVTPPAGNNTIIIVDNKDYSIGTENKNDQNTTATVDQPKLTDEIAKASDSSSVIVPVSANTNVTAQLVVKNVEDMAKKDMVLTVQTGNVAYNLNTSAIDTSKITASLGNADSKDIPFNISISNSKAVVNGATIVVSPVEFTITATYNGKTKSVDTFSCFVDRTIEITADQAKQITTAVVVQPDGSLRHVPTKVEVVNGKYYAVINSLTNSTYTVVWHPVEFSDVATNWAKNAINDMGSRMVVTGVGNSNYEPDRNITRAEFAAIVVRALGLAQGTGKSTFSDVDSGAWYCGYIATASAYGIIKGYSATTFGPSDTISREQAMTMISRAMEITGLNPKFADNDISVLLGKYSDATAASDYAKSSICACLKTGIISGRSSTTLAPKDFITRAEVAVVVQRLLQKSGLI